MHEAMSWGRQEYLKLRYCIWCRRTSIYISVQFEVSLHVTSISVVVSVFLVLLVLVFFSVSVSIFSVSVFFEYFFAVYHFHSSQK